MTDDNKLLKFPIRETVTAEEFQKELDKVRDLTTLLAMEPEAEFRDGNGPFAYVITPRSMRQYSCTGFLGSKVKLLRQVSIQNRRRA